MFAMNNKLMTQISEKINKDFQFLQTGKPSTETMIKESENDEQPEESIYYSRDGWNKRELDSVIEVLNSCARVAYEINNCRRGAYCKYAKNAVSLGRYIQQLGDDLMSEGTDIIENSEDEE